MGEEEKTGNSDRYQSQQGREENLEIKRGSVPIRGFVCSKRVEVREFKRR